MAQPYYDAIHLLERLHRHFLDVLKIELDRIGVQDINNVQSLILYNIGEDELTVGELTARGYYLGSNVSYNVKGMVQNGYIEQQRSLHDRRSVRVKLSAKGRSLHSRINAMFDRQIAGLQRAGLSADALRDATASLSKIERFWSGNLFYGTSAGLARPA